METEAPAQVQRRTAAAAIPAALVALGVALLGPRLFSDPVAVDPFSLRLSVVAVALVAVAWRAGRDRGPLPALLGVAGIAAPFTAWAATPSLVADLAGDRVSFDARVLAADAVYLAATLGVLWVAWALLPAGRRPELRLGITWPAAALAVAGSALVVGVFMALPAMLLGRLAVEPAALARDLPLLAPAFALQAAAQELQFRGLLLGALELDLPRWVANLGQAALFGAAHVAVQYEGPAGPFIPVTAALGLLLGWLTQRTRSLWPAVAIHVTVEWLAGFAVLDGLYGY